MKLVILDRDGVINYDSTEYIKSPDEWRPIPGALNAIARLNATGFIVAIATNQSGIARGLYNHKTLNKIHAKMADELAKVGGHIDAVYYCPHHPNDGCECRKPKPGLLLQIAKHFDTNLAEVPFIGDKASDADAAKAAGCTPILLKDNTLAMVVENL